jgi:HK97 family phage major capsid protein
MTSTIEVARANLSLRKDLQGEIRTIAEAATTDNRPYTEDEQTQLTELRSKLDAADERAVQALDLQTRSDDLDSGIDAFLGHLATERDTELIDTRSIGERFVEDESFESWRSSGARGSFAFDLEGLDLRSVTDATNATGSAGALQRPAYAPRIGQDFLTRRNYLIDYLPHGVTSDNSVPYVQDTSPLADLANKGVEVTEGSAKPQAGVTLAAQVDPVATIAAWVNITRQAASDNGQIMSYLDTKLRYSLKRRADAQSINGDGNTPNLKGLLQRSGIATYAPGSTEARYKSIRHAITVGEQAEAIYEIIVLNPADAELFDLANEASAGIHAQLDSAPLAMQPTAWGLRVVKSNAIASGTGMLVDPTAVMVWDRQQPTAYMTDSHSTNFTSNILTLLLELRMALTLFDPKGVCAVTFHD